MREKLKKWWRGFVDKQKLAVIDSTDGSTKWYMYISPGRIVVGLVTLILIVVIAVVILVAYTPLMDTIPGYPGRHSRQALMEGVMKLDSLEREMANLTVYSDNIALIMEGKTPVVRNTTRIGDSIEMQDKTLVPPSGADSVLRMQMEGEGDYSLAGSAAAVRTARVSEEYILPAHGPIQTRFSPVGGRFGVEIVTAAESPVVAVREGSVIMSVWTPDAGYIVQIQHPGDVVSTYKHLSEVRQSVGVRVVAGENIGVVQAPPLGFELWFNGTAVDPENYIVF